MLYEFMGHHYEIIVNWKLAAVSIYWLLATYKLLSFQD